MSVYCDSEYRRSPIPDSFLILVLFVLAVGCILLAVTWTKHAMDTTHTESPALRTCYNNGKFLRNMVYKEEKRSTIYLPCEFSPGLWGVIIFDLANNQVVNQYKTGDGTWKALINFLSKRGTRYTKPLPPSIP